MIGTATLPVRVAHAGTREVRDRWPRFRSRRFVKSWALLPIHTCTVIVASRMSVTACWSRCTGSLPSTNGPCEGINTKTKFLKRQMYDRAGFQLLRHRILLG